MPARVSDTCLVVRSFRAFGKRFASRGARAIAGALLAASGAAASAATLTWDANGTAGGTGSWSAADWNNGTSLVTWPGSGNTALFSGTPGTVTVGTQTASGLTFSVGGYTLSGGTLTLTTGTVISTSGGTTTFNGTAIAGAAGDTITKTGSGTLALNTTDGSLGTAASPAVWTVSVGTYSGGIFNSILSIAAGNNLGATPTVATTQLVLNAGTLQVTGTGLNPAIGPNRTIQINALGGAIIDSTGNPYQGAIVDNAGSSTSLYLSNTSGTTSISGAISGTGGLTWNGAGTLSLSNTTNSYTGGTTVDSGVLQFATDSNLGGASSTVTLNGGTLSSAQTAAVAFTQTLATGTIGGTIQLNNATPTSSANKLTLAGTNQITGSGAITVNNNGCLSIDASNSSFSGNWTLNGGVTELESATAAGTGSIAVNSGAELTTLGSQISNALTLNGGTISWDYYSGSGVYRGPVTLQSANTVALSNFYGSGSIAGTISGNIIGGGSLATTATNTGNTSYGGVLTISGTGNTYGGGTTVGLGTTLQVATGSSLGTGSLSVNGTVNLGGNNLGVSTLNSQSGNLYFALGASGTPNQLTVANSGSTLSGTTGIEINTAAATGITPGTYTLISAGNGGLTGAVSFAGGQALTVPATSSIQKIGGTNYRLTLSDSTNAVSVTVAPAPSKVINVMPLGSSITAGQSAQDPYNGGGYRSQLYQNLVNDGRFTPEFVGSNTNNLANDPTGTDLMTAVGQTAHEGHPGYTTSQVLNNLNGNDGSGGNDGGYWLAPGNGVNPDYITLNIGGNDFVANPTDATAINRLDQIITDIATLRPNATIIVSNIMIRTDGGGAYAAGFDSLYNPYIPGLVYNHVLEGQHVQFLDLASQISASQLSSDGIHPTQATYDVIGNLWYSSMVTGSAYFTGAQGQSWSATSGSSTSWAMDYDHSTNATTVPGANTDVYFDGGGSGVTTLGQNFSVRSVNFTSGATASVTIAGSNTLTIGSGGITVQAGTGAHTISAPVILGSSQTWSNVSAKTLAVVGVITGNSTLTIDGTGVISLMASNGYTGGTVIAGGVLVADNTSGSATGTAAVTIDAGATLAGTGSIGGLTTVLGTIAPSQQGLTSAAELSLPGGVINDGTIALDLFGPGVDDNLNIGSFNVGTGEIVVASTGGFTFAGGQSWDLVNWTSKLGTLSSSDVILPTLSTGLSWNTSQLDSSGIVSITAVPEPTVLTSLLTGGLLLTRRRRRWQASALPCV